MLSFTFAIKIQETGFIISLVLVVVKGNGDNVIQFKGDNFNHISHSSKIRLPFKRNLWDILPRRLLYHIYIQYISVEITNYTELIEIGKTN